MAWMLYGIEIDTLAIAAGAVKAIGGFILKGVWDKMMNTVCMVPKCQRLGGVMTKGMCPVCYKQAKEKVTIGATTWEKLAEMGLCKLAEQNSPFNDAYSKATEEDTH